jgi:NAD(P)-dependent dehydrogenase (short-subunit alcohol dehydrogenase family)
VADGPPTSFRYQLNEHDGTEGQRTLRIQASYPSLRDRAVLVTGGASGIGAAIVEAFAMQGSRVAFLDIQDSAADILVRKIEVAGSVTPLYYHCDLRNIGAITACINDVLERLRTVDVLINNAGNDVRHSIEGVTSEYWDQLMAINLKHQFFTTQAVIPAMRKAGRGSIINMSSISWSIPSIGLPVYVAAKAAIVGLTRTLAHELGTSNIRVNCVMPGAIQTERQERLWLTEAYKAEILARQALKRIITPDEVASLILFLAADESASITNQSFVIDGGWT